MPHLISASVSVGRRAKAVSPLRQASKQERSPPEQTQGRRIRPSFSFITSNSTKERKYFDSGDYALSKAGKASDIGGVLGREHPHPENIPHLSTSPHGPNGGNGGGINLPPNSSSHNGNAGPSGSPVKESSFLNREQSIDDQPGESEEERMANVVSPPPHREGMPIRGSAQ